MIKKKYWVEPDWKTNMSMIKSGFNCMSCDMPLTMFSYGYVIFQCDNFECELNGRMQSKQSKYKCKGCHTPFNENHEGIVVFCCGNLECKMLGIDQEKYFH